MTDTRAQLVSIKNATVAVAFMHDVISPAAIRNPPFTILGSGFCVDGKGIIITCKHVMEAFMQDSIEKQLAIMAKAALDDTGIRRAPVKALIPHALFYIPSHNEREIVVAAVGVRTMQAKTNSPMDLGVLRLGSHDAFPNGFPTIPIAPFEDIHEGMEAGTCGFPLGTQLQAQLGTVTSSFTRGIVSSIIPSAGANRKYVTGFQLDLRATHGNSGGPVFSSSTGQVFGVLQGGIDDQYKHPLFTRAESVYQAFDSKLVESVLNPPKEIEESLRRMDDEVHKQR